MSAATGRERAVVFLLIAVLAGPLMLVLGMTKRLNHDEHQHVAAGALLAREGLLPYRDFPHFHTPYLAFTYALLFRTTDHLLLAARLFSVLCATAIAAVLGALGYDLFRERGRSLAGGVAAGAVVLCVTAGLFTQTTGRAWNHEPALLFALLAFVAHVAGLQRGKDGWLVASGALLGLAIGTRLTFAPLVAPFGLALVLHEPLDRWQPRALRSFIGGLLLGGAGLLVLFATAAEQTFFGNFEFAQVNIAYRFGSGEPRTMTLLPKLRYLFKEILRREVPLFAAALLPAIAAHLATRGTSRRWRFELRFALLLLPFLLLGSFAPSPLFQQYFLPFVPFLIVVGLYALASIPAETRWFRPALLAALVCAGSSAALGRHAFKRLDRLFTPREWTPIMVHREAAIIRAQVTSGRVLTLAPTHPLEAGLSIYPPFATGPFAWRVSAYVEPAKAGRLGMTTPATLPALLAADPPAALLLGYESTESAFEEYANLHGYRPLNLSAGHTLWIAGK